MEFNNLKTLYLEAYGVKIAIDFSNNFNYADIADMLVEALPLEFEIFEDLEPEHHFKISKKTNKKYNLRKNKEPSVSLRSEQETLERLESQVRLTVAEHAVSRVFVHAGVVEINERAVIIPARSFKGKTTLVVELIKAGATYYSDEYAVVDDKGLVYPFPKSLSVRGIIDDYTQLERPVSFYGGKAGTKPVQAGLILVTEYVKYSRWKPIPITQGESVLELINNTVPIRNRPEQSLKVLNKLANRAYSYKTKRGEAERFAGKLYELCKNELFV